MTNKIVEAMAAVEVAAIEQATGKVSNKRLRDARMALLDAIDSELKEAISQAVLRAALAVMPGGAS